MLKKLMLFILFISFCTITYAQREAWILGAWKSAGTTGNTINTINIKDVSGESFTGTKTSELSNTKIIISISGAFRAKGIYLQSGDIISKEGNAQGNDCSSCAEDNRMIIKRDSLILVDSISGCNNSCDCVTYYYRLLTEYDNATQHDLVDRFGRPSDIIGFHPYETKKEDTLATKEDENKEPVKEAVVPVTMTADANAETVKRRQDSLDNIARIKQEQKENAARLAEQKKREKQIADSLNLAQQKNQQRIKDSLANAAKLEKIRLKTEDSLRNVQAKKRQKEISDSLNLAQQKEKQRIKDSLDNVARLEKIRLRTEDSLRNALAKKRQQEIADSVTLAKQKQQQRIKDSLENVARIRQQRINDSTQLAQQKKREKEIADSLNLAQQKERQRIKDSLDNVARLEKIRLHTEDSLRNAQLKKKQQEVADSISLANKKEQQRIKDSLQNAAIANLQKQRAEDSLRNIQAKKRQQEIADSLARRKQYNDSLQKAALAKAAKPKDSVETSDNKALTTRASVLLQTYHITSPDILIELFDNGEIDSDRVTVYHNNTVIVSNQVLGTKPITLSVHADASNREHEFVMIAENLGSIPPNSALMRITAGKQSYKLPVNTDMKTNARIVFYYDGN